MKKILPFLAIAAAMAASFVLASCDEPETDSVNIPVTSADEFEFAPGKWDVTEEATYTVAGMGFTHETTKSVYDISGTEDASAVSKTTLSIVQKCVAETAEAYTQLETMVDTSEEASWWDTKKDPGKLTITQTATDQHPSKQQAYETTYGQFFQSNLASPLEWAAEENAEVPVVTEVLTNESKTVITVRVEYSDDGADIIEKTTFAKQ